MFEWYHSDTVQRMAMTLRTNSELDAALAYLAKVEGVSKQEAAKRAILHRAERLKHTEAVHAAATRMKQRWGNVLDRLGDS